MIEKDDKTKHIIHFTLLHNGGREIIAFETEEDRSIDTKLVREKKIMKLNSTP